MSSLRVEAVAIRVTYAAGGRYRVGIPGLRLELAPDRQRLGWLERTVEVTREAGGKSISGAGGRYPSEE